MSDRSESVKDKFKTHVANDGYDYYSILGFKNLPPKDCEKLTTREIKKNFAKNLKTYHPDRVPKDISKEDRVEYNVMFNLIKKAGNILTDSNRRKAYDMERSISKSSGHENKRDDFKAFMKMQEREMSEEGKQTAQLEFNKGLSEFKIKHGADKLSDTPLTIHESDNLYETFDTLREQEDIELMPTQINFADNKFDHATFMKAFEKERIKKQKIKGNRELLSYDDIGTYADASTFGSNIDDNYGGLYNEGKFSGNNRFGGVSDDSDNSDDYDNSDDSGDSDDLNSISSEKYTKDIPLTEKSANDLMKERMAEREQLDTLYKDRSVDRFKSSMEDKFGPSSSLGFMVGTDYHGVQVHKKKYEHLDDDEVNAYRKMLDYKDKDNSDHKSKYKSKSKSKQKSRTRSDSDELVGVKNTKLHISESDDESDELVGII